MDDNGLVELTQAADGQLCDGGRQGLAPTFDQLDGSPMQARRQIDGGSDSRDIEASVLMQPSRCALPGTDDGYTLKRNSTTSPSAMT